MGVEHRPVDLNEKSIKSWVKVRGLTNHFVNVYIAEKTFLFFFAAYFVVSYRSNGKFSCVMI